MRSDTVFGSNQESGFTVVSGPIDVMHKRGRDARLASRIRAMACCTFCLERPFADHGLRAQGFGQFNLGQWSPGLLRSRVGRDHFGRCRVLSAPIVSRPSNCQDANQGNGFLVHRESFFEVGKPARTPLELSDQFDLCADLRQIKQVGNLLIVQTDAAIGRSPPDLARVIGAMDAIVLPTQI